MKDRFDIKESHHRRSELAERNKGQRDEIKEEKEDIFSLNYLVQTFWYKINM